MKTQATEDKAFIEEIDAIARDQVQLQITCMILHHEGCNKVRNNDMERGLAMIDAVKEMRAAYAEQTFTLLDAVSDEELAESHNRTGFYKTLYSTVSDAVLMDNKPYFDLTRPKDGAYKCDELACKAKIFSLTTDYFPNFI